MILAKIEPRMVPKHQIKPIEFADSKSVRVLQIHKSIVGPHMVKTDNSRFFARGSGIKYSLDHAQIRDAFLNASGLAEQIVRFRENRIASILADETPVVVRGDADREL